MTDEKKEEKEEKKGPEKRPREKPSPSKSDRPQTSSSDSGNQYQKRKMAAGQLPQQPESDTRRKKLNQLKEQFAQLKSQKKSVETGPTDEDVKTVPVKREENPKVEETTALGVEEKKEEKEKNKTPEGGQNEMTARTWNTNLEDQNNRSDNQACRHALTQTPVTTQSKEENSFKKFFRIISSNTSSTKKKKYKEGSKEKNPDEPPVIRSLAIAAPQYEDDYGVQHKFDGYTSATRESGNTDAVQTLKAQMESKNQSRARCVRILAWIMKIAAIVCVVLSILGWIAVFLLTVRISNNSFDIVRIDQACSPNPLDHFPDTQAKNGDKCRKPGMKIADIEWQEASGGKGRYRKLTKGVLYRKEAGDSIFEQT